MTISVGTVNMHLSNALGKAKDVYGVGTLNLIGGTIKLYAGTVYSGTPSFNLIGWSSESGDATAFSFPDDGYTWTYTDTMNELTAKITG